MRLTTFGAVALCLVGSAVACNKGSGGSGGAAATGSAATKTTPAAATQTGGLVEVALDPLPLKIKVPAGGIGTMDMSIGDAKSVTVDIGGAGGAGSLNISDEPDDLAGVKKSYEGDTVLFPFKAWAKTDGNLAIEQWDNDGKTAYLGFKLVSVAGKSYLCKTTGVEGLASVDDAAKNLKVCDTIVAK
jgi:hypothetical protein